jgi:hypothetical protein
LLPDFERADRIGEFWGHPESRAFAELLIDCEEDRTLRGRARGNAAGGGTRRLTPNPRAGCPMPVEIEPSRLWGGSDEPPRPRPFLRGDAMAIRGLTPFPGGCWLLKDAGSRVGGFHDNDR